MSNQKPFQLQFFLPDARLLSQEEIDALPENKRRSVEASGKDGIWIQIACPDRSCLDSEGRITFPTQEQGKKGFFLNLFCPEDSCEIVQSTDMP